MPRAKKKKKDFATSILVNKVSLVDSDVDGKVKNMRRIFFIIFYDHSSRVFHVFAFSKFLLSAPLSNRPVSKMKKFKSFLYQIRK